MKPFEKGDIIISYYHHCYDVLMVTNPALSISIIGELSISVMSENENHEYLHHPIDRIKVNCGQISFEDFYENIDRDYPEYSTNIVRVKVSR